MYKRSAIIICILFLALSSVALFLFLPTRADGPSYSYESNVVRLNGRLYYSDGAGDGYRLFSYDGNGELDKACVDGESGEVAGMCACEDQLALLLTDDYIFDEEKKEYYRSYQIRIISTGFVPEETSVPVLLHANENAVDLQMENGLFFITGVSFDGSKAEVYSVDRNTLQILQDPQEETTGKKKNDKEEPEPIRLDSLMLQVPASGHFIVDAAYRDGGIEIRTDADVPTGAFAVDEGAVEVVSRTRLRLLHRFALCRDFTVFWIAGTLLILIVIILLFMAFYNRRRLIYTALVVEMTFIVMLMIFLTALVFREREARQDARREYAISSMSWLAEELNGIDESVEGFNELGWYDSAAYRTAQRELADFVSRGSNSRVFYDIMIVARDSGMILNSAGGHNRQPIWEVVGANARDLLDEDEVKVLVGGQGYKAIAWYESRARSYAMLVAVLNDASESRWIWQNRAQVAGRFLWVLALGSIILFGVIWIQSEDFRVFEEAITEVALRNQTQLKGPGIGHDMTVMWNSLLEICKKIEKINYSKFRIYEAYYRFAPRNIEKILGKDSMSEVHSGDVTALDGTLSLVAGNAKSTVDERIEQLNELLSFMNVHPDKEGILIDQNSELSVIELLFLDNVLNTQSFGVDLVKDRQETGISSSQLTVLLYYGGFTYGVAGTQDQSIAFLLEEELQDLFSCAEWLRTLRLGVVVSQEVKDRENFPADYRYIGYVSLPTNGRQLKLYEVLDACTDSERQAKMEDRERFEEALQLLYRRDFYVARNRFSEILKRLPQDEVVRWYLFESERLLDLGAKAAEGEVGALHWDTDGVRKVN